MSPRNAIAKNLAFWHRPRFLVKDLSPEQARWQPEGHDTSVLFALWHTYRAGDEICHGLGMGGRPSVYQRDGWASRLAVDETGRSPFGNGMTRDQIGALALDAGAVCDYAEAVGASLIDYIEKATDAELAQEVELPFFRGVYEGVDSLSRLEVITFFAIGHNCEHLGEVQMVRGLMGLRGALL